MPIRRSVCWRQQRTLHVHRSDCSVLVAVWGVSWPTNGGWRADRLVAHDRHKMLVSTYCCEARAKGAGMLPVEIRWRRPPPLDSAGAIVMGGQRG